MSLTDTVIRHTAPRAKPYKLFDGGGLYLEVAPSGGRLWRLKYRFDGKEKRLALGTYPDVPLASRKDKTTGVWIEGARERRDRARQLLAQGVDPGAHKQALKQSREIEVTNSFEIVAREWVNKFSACWKPSHRAVIVHRLERDVFPWIGNKPIADLKAPDILSVLRRIEGRGAVDTAHRAGQYCGQVFRYAIVTGRADRDPSADLRGALVPKKVVHRAAITDPKAIGALLRAIDGYEGYFVTKCALRLAPLVFVRPGELRDAEWSEIDLDKAEWNIPGERMKMQEPHLVPLSKQALAILNELNPATGRGRFLFPSARSSTRPMSNNAVLAALRRMGFTKDEMTGHGFRAMARTVLDEVLGVRPDYIEHQLAHSVRDPLGRAYNRTAHLEERRRMMQQWADYLDQLRNGAEIVPIRQGR